MFARFAVSVAVGFLGAYPLASASGLLGTSWVREDYEQRSLVIGAGMILLFLTLALIGPTLRLIRQILDALARVEERPRPAVALTMLVLGTLCAISAMMIQLTAANRTPASVSMNIPGFNGGNVPGFAAGQNVAFQSSGGFGLGILTFLTFLLGASLIGLGIWASLKPSTIAPTIARIIKPEARELDEVAS